MTKGMLVLDCLQLKAQVITQFCLRESNSPLVQMKVWRSPTINLAHTNVMVHCMLMFRTKMRFYQFYNKKIQEQLQNANKYSNNTS